VSLFGIVNTLALSVLERTRELGMLRAIGMSRRQVRRMIRHASVVTALIGAVLGIGVGLFLAGLATAALSGEGLRFAVPVASLIAFTVVAGVAGALAAMGPARPASRLDVLHALQYEYADTVTGPSQPDSGRRRASAARAPLPRCLRGPPRARPGCASSPAACAGSSIRAFGPSAR
jgi:FtsX-like permease family